MDELTLTGKAVPDCLASYNSVRGNEPSFSVQVLMKPELLLFTCNNEFIQLPVRDYLPPSLENFPNQVHLSLGANWNEIVVTWSTPHVVASPIVQFVDVNETAPLQHALAISERFVDNGTLHHEQYIHRAWITTRHSSTWYQYRVGNYDENVWSQWFQFKSAVESHSWTNPSFTVYGDFGLKNPRAFSALLTNREQGSNSIIIHTGQFH